MGGQAEFPHASPALAPAARARYPARSARPARRSVMSKFYFIFAIFVAACGAKPASVVSTTTGDSTSANADAEIVGDTGPATCVISSDCD